MKKVFFPLIVTLFFLIACTHMNDQVETSDNEDEHLQKTSDSSNEKDSNKIFSRKNILLVGVDSRGEKSSNSDTIIIAQYDRNDQSLKLASIMRDSYVKIPNYSKKYNKINHAFLLGGTDLLKETIYNNFGINIDSVAVVDFEGFVNVINLIAPDGIEVDVPQAMINNMKLDVSEGRQRLFGSDILKYVRFRKDAQSDFGRVKRQQEVLISLKDEAFKRLTKLDGIVKIPKLFSELTSNVETDLTMDEITALATELILNPVKDVKTLRIPVENSFENKSVNHAGAILEINFKENIEAIEQFFSEEEMVNKDN